MTIANRLDVPLARIEEPIHLLQCGLEIGHSVYGLLVVFSSTKFLEPRSIALNSGHSLGKLLSKEPPVLPLPFVEQALPLCACEESEVVGRVCLLEPFLVVDDATLVVQQQGRDR